MEAKLTYNLPEEDTEFRQAINGSKWESVSFDLNNHLRYEMKHTDMSEDRYAAFEYIQGKLFEFMAENGVEFSP
jgi:hypothetical protein